MMSASARSIGVHHRKQAHHEISNGVAPCVFTRASCFRQKMHRVKPVRIQLVRFVRAAFMTAPAMPPSKSSSPSARSVCTDRTSTAALQRRIRNRSVYNIDGSWFSKRFDPNAQVHWFGLHQSQQSLQCRSDARHSRRLQNLGSDKKCP